MNCVSRSCTEWRWGHQRICHLSLMVALSEFPPFSRLLLVPLKGQRLTLGQRGFFWLENLIRFDSIWLGKMQHFGLTEIQSTHRLLVRKTALCWLYAPQTMVHWSYREIQFSKPGNIPLIIFIPFDFSSFNGNSSSINNSCRKVESGQATAATATIQHNATEYQCQKPREIPVM